MSLLKRMFEQLKIAQKNDAKTKPSILDISQSPIECGLASNKNQFRSKNDRFRKYFFCSRSLVYHKKPVEDRECHISTGINLKSSSYTRYLRKAQIISHTIRKTITFLPVWNAVLISNDSASVSMIFNDSVKVTISRLNP